MKAADPATENAARWSKTQYANLIRYVPSGKYFARIRVQGKLILKSLKTNRISVAKLRLADLEKEERQKAENQTAMAVTSGKMTFIDVLAQYRERLKADVNLKPRSKEYREERVGAILKSWPELNFFSQPCGRAVNRTHWVCSLKIEHDPVLRPNGHDQISKRGE